MSAAKNVPSTISELTTPCFLLDVDRMESNCQRMLDVCRRLNVTLRSHTKTHKTVEGAVLSTGGTRRGLACSTLSECEMYADNGFDDILLAYPITADKLPRCAQLTNRLSKFLVMVSGPEGVQCLKENTGLLTTGKQWTVYIELDCSYGRSGISSESELLLQVASSVHQDLSMTLEGLYTHCGQSYTHLLPAQRKEGQKQLLHSLLGAASRLRAAGIEVPVVGTGSTPTCSLPDPVLSSLDEFHPGNYVFNDCEQMYLGACKEEDIAVCVATRVVCQRKDLNTILVDCGFTALSQDGRLQAGDNFCRIKDHPHLRMTMLSQELGKIEAREGHSLNFDLYPVGSMLFIYPYHSCATAVMHGAYMVHSGNKIVGCWKPIRGW